MNFDLKIKRILGPNWIPCTVLILAILVGMVSEFLPLQYLEYKAYDLMASQRKRQDTSPVVIVAVDDESVSNIGSWPWPRSYVADVVRRLSGYGANTLGIHILYAGKELNLGLQEIQGLRETLVGTEPPLAKKKALKKIDEMLARTENKLNHDARLTSAVRSAVNVVLPILFTLGQPDGNDPAKASAWLKMNSLKSKKRVSKPKRRPLNFLNTQDVFKHQAVAARKVITPFRQLSTKAGALGHINIVPDQDGVVRKVPLLIDYDGRRFPSFPLQVAAKKVGATMRDIKLGDVGNGLFGIRLKGLDIPTDRHYQMLIDYNGHRPDSNSRFSFSDVLDGKVPPNAFRGKIVLLGITANGLAPRYRTPVNQAMPSVDIAASAVENILNRKHFVRPAWAGTLEILVVLYFGLFLLVVIPRVTPQVGALMLGIFLISWLGVASVLFMAHGYWLKVFAPVVLSVVGYAVVRYRTPFGKRQDESAELNKALGLSFQSQGMLDMAFEKFLKCPIQHKSAKELLYNLGLDFERKRMFNKALAVYEHIMKEGDFKDIAERIKRFKSLEDSLVLGANSAKHEETLILEDLATNPTLGRYEILKELGQGAMGTVYLGKDPKINREVAIKTLRYREVDPDQLEQVKKRFFREAEAAGKLSHPNIATIFDVGEDYDMAYMAMELIKGENLTGCCRQGKLLSVTRALSLVSQVAEALGYAHSHGVVHRDIKPANIMLLKNDHIKVADFGIARVIASSKSSTQTGLVLGTPSYMSPEQVAGKKVDGRSDLFSLGVVLYELLAGDKPFKGDNIGALMYAISKASCTPLAEVAPDVPACCVNIVDKLLAKGVTRRFKTADDLVKQIQLCLEKLD